MVEWVLVNELTTSSSGLATFSLGCEKWNMGPFPIKIFCLESQLSKTQNKWKWVHVVMDLLTLILGEELFIAWPHFDIVKGAPNL